MFAHTQHLTIPVIGLENNFVSAVAAPFLISAENLNCRRAYFGATCTSHDAATLPSLTVATMVCPASPVVSSLMARVPWPARIWPALTRHRKLIFGCRARSAEIVTVSPGRAREDGQVTYITGTWERKISWTNDSGRALAGTDAVAMTWSLPRRRLKYQYYRRGRCSVTEAKIGLTIRNRPCGDRPLPDRR